MSTELDRREFLRLLTAVAVGGGGAVGTAVSGCGGGPPMRDDVGRCFLILGFDGVDPRLLERWTEEGALPFLARLRREGAYRRLATTVPPESPVAWSSFATGVNPGKHRIYDFLSRDPLTYEPEIAEVENDPPRFLWDLFPTRRPRVVLRRRGTTFWRTLADHGFRSTVVQVPVSFPPEELPGGRLLSGLSVPDLRGTQGTFQYFATDLTREEIEDTEMGGKLVPITVRDGRVRTEIQGPWDPVLRDKRRRLEKKLAGTSDSDDVRALRARLRELARRPGVLTESLEMVPDPAHRSMVIRFQGREQRVTEGRWSDWFEVSFEITPIVHVHGIAHFYVERVSPEIRVYLGPIELHPAHPPLPISYPSDLSVELCDAIGFYKTRGWAADTAALQDERMDEATFLSDLEVLMASRERILFHLLDAHPWHCFVDVFSCTDRVQHMFWRFLDPRSPRYDARLATRWEDAVLRIYRRMDRIAARVYEEHVGPDTAFVLMSDHGFHSFNRSVNLNTWLVRSGYMHLRGMERPGYRLEDLFGGGDFWPNVVWERTKAYAMGLGQIYINLSGREGKGVVQPGSDYDRTVSGIVQGLLKLRDSDGTPAILSAHRAREVFSGDYLDEAPDIQVGFNEGYRVSWQTCLGGVPREVIEDNPRKWSGDHCSYDSGISSGVFLANRSPLRDPHILDLAPTVLDWFGVPVPGGYDGAPLFAV
jgi:predicted AlkP superfamily phosphohydrolase/phosphomutase